MKKIFTLLLLFPLILGTTYKSGAKLSGGTRSLPPGEIITLGDSICGGSQGFDDGLKMQWRDHLQNQLGISTYRFIGIYQQPASDSTYDVDTACHAGFDTSEIEAEVATNLALFSSSSTIEKIVTYMAGTNDDLTTSGNRDAAVTNVQDALNLVRTTVPSAKFYLFTLIPHNSAQSSGANQNINAYNTALLAMVTSYKATYPSFTLHTVDQNGAMQADRYGLCGGSHTNCLGDTVHPNDLTGSYSGYKTMAYQLFDCLRDSTVEGCDGN